MLQTLCIRCVRHTLFCLVRPLHPAPCCQLYVASKVKHSVLPLRQPVVEHAEPVVGLGRGFEVSDLVCGSQTPAQTHETAGICMLVFLCVCFVSDGFRPLRAYYGIPISPISLG